MMSEARQPHLGQAREALICFEQEASTFLASTMGRPTETLVTICLTRSFSDVDERLTPWLRLLGKPAGTLGKQTTFQPVRDDVNFAHA
jgi:hypothetical protein